MGPVPSEGAVSAQGPPCLQALLGLEGAWGYESQVHQWLPGNHPWTQRRGVTCMIFWLWELHPLPQNKALGTADLQKSQGSGDDNCLPIMVTK